MTWYCVFLGPVKVSHIYLLPAMNVVSNCFYLICNSTILKLLLSVTELISLSYALSCVCVYWCFFFFTWDNLFLFWSLFRFFLLTQQFCDYEFCWTPEGKVAAKAVTNGVNLKQGKIKKNLWRNSLDFSKFCGILWRFSTVFSQLPALTATHAPDVCDPAVARIRSSLTENLETSTL